MLVFTLLRGSLMSLWKARPGQDDICLAIRHLNPFLITSSIIFDASLMFSVDIKWSTAATDKIGAIAKTPAVAVLSPIGLQISKVAAGETNLEAFNKEAFG